MSAAIQAEWKIKTERYYRQQDNMWLYILMNDLSDVLSLKSKCGRNATLTIDINSLNEIKTFSFMSLHMKDVKSMEIYC